MCKCSEVFENKFVQCFDQQEIAMYMKSNGVVKLVHGDVVEMTNINFCPYCGRKLTIGIDINTPAKNAGAMAMAPITQDTLQIDVQKEIQKTIEKSMFDISNLGSNFMQGGCL